MGKFLVETQNLSFKAQLSTFRPSHSNWTTQPTSLFFFNLRNSQRYNKNHSFNTNTKLFFYVWEACWWILGWWMGTSGGQAGLPRGSVGRESIRRYCRDFKNQVLLDHHQFFFSQLDRQNNCSSESWSVLRRIHYYFLKLWLYFLPYQLD